MAGLSSVSLRRFQTNSTCKLFNAVKCISLTKMSFDPAQSDSEDARAPLNRDVITDAALDLLDEVGLEKLSTRRLATKLGIQSASLYWHFRNKDELFDAMSRRLHLTRIPQPESSVAGPDWRTWLANGARAINRTALSIRDGSRIMVRLRFDEPDFLDRIAERLAILESAGFSEQDARGAFETLHRFAIGSATHAQANPEGADAPKDSFFEFGLTLILDSLERRLDEQDARLPES